MKTNSNYFKHFRVLANFVNEYFRPSSSSQRATRQRFVDFLINQYITMKYIWMPNMKSLPVLVHKLWLMLKLVIWPIYLTFGLEGWPWPWHVCTQNVRLHEIHMHAKYEVSTCIISKVMAKFKVGCKQTNRHGKKNMPPFSGGGINSILNKSHVKWPSSPRQQILLTPHSLRRTIALFL